MFSEVCNGKREVKFATAKEKQSLQWQKRIAYDDEYNLFAMAKENRIEVFQSVGIRDKNKSGFIQNVGESTRTRLMLECCKVQRELPGKLLQSAKRIIW